MKESLQHRSPSAEGGVQWNVVGAVGHEVQVGASSGAVLGVALLVQQPLVMILQGLLVPPVRLDGDAKATRLNAVLVDAPQDVGGRTAPRRGAFQIRGRLIRNGRIVRLIDQLGIDEGGASRSQRHDLAVGKEQFQFGALTENGDVVGFSHQHQSGSLGGRRPEDTPASAAVPRIPHS